MLQVTIRLDNGNDIFPAISLYHRYHKGCEYQLEIAIAIFVFEKNANQIHPLNKVLDQQWLHQRVTRGGHYSFTIVRKIHQDFEFFSCWAFIFHMKPSHKQPSIRLFTI